MFYFLDNRDKCRKPGFLRGNINTSCISMVLLDHFANKSNTFQHSLSLPLSLSHLFPFPPWVSTSSYPGYQDTAIKGTLGPKMTQGILTMAKGLRSVLGPHKLRSCLDERFCQFWPPLMLNSCGLLHCTDFSSSILVLQWIKKPSLIFIPCFVKDSAERRPLDIFNFLFASADVSTNNEHFKRSLPN